MGMDKSWKRFFTLACVLIIIVLIATGLGLDHEDKEDSPVQGFLEENYEEMGADNLVESVLLDLRAYDTFGEVIILYIAIAGVIILGKEMKKANYEKEEVEGKDEGGDDG